MTNRQFLESAADKVIDIFLKREMNSIYGLLSDLRFEYQDRREKTKGNFNDDIDTLGKIQANNLLNALAAKLPHVSFEHIANSRLAPIKHMILNHPYKAKNYNLIPCYPRREGTVDQLAKKYDEEIAEAFYTNNQEYFADKVREFQDMFKHKVGVDEFVKLFTYFARLSVYFDFPANPKLTFLVGISEKNLDKPGYASFVFIPVREMNFSRLLFELDSLYDAYKDGYAFVVSSDVKKLELSLPKLNAPLKTFTQMPEIASLINKCIGRLQDRYPIDWLLDIEYNSFNTFELEQDGYKRPKPLSYYAEMFLYEVFAAALDWTNLHFSKYFTEKEINVMAFLFYDAFTLYIQNHDKIQLA